MVSHSKAFDYFDWQSPNQMMRSVDQHKVSLGYLALKSPGQSFREAHVASRFAKFRSAYAVKLLKPRHGQQTPDFALKFDNSELWFETTEIDRPGRKRGDEYKADAPPESKIADDEWSTPIQLEPVVRNRVAAKCAKNYDKCDGLLLWFNAFPVEDSDLLTKTWWERLAMPASTRFDEVWVHSSGEFKLLFA